MADRDTIALGMCGNCRASHQYIDPELYDQHPAGSGQLIVRVLLGPELKPGKEAWDRCPTCSHPVHTACDHPVPSEEGQ